MLLQMAERCVNRLLVLVRRILFELKLPRQLLYLLLGLSERLAQIRRLTVVVRLFTLLSAVVELRCHRRCFLITRELIALPFEVEVRLVLSETERNDTGVVLCKP